MIFGEQYLRIIHGIFINFVPKQRHRSIVDSFTELGIEIDADMYELFLDVKIKYGSYN